MISWISRTDAKVIGDAVWVWFSIWRGGMTLLVERRHRVAGYCAFWSEYQQTYDVVTIFEACLEPKLGYDLNVFM